MDLKTGDENLLKGIIDDDILIKSYNESLELAKEKLAKRLAAATNTNKTTNMEIEENTEEMKKIYVVGDYVRATYDDGIDYEAKILEINEGKGTCLLKYIGYENEQMVKLDKLIPSWGKSARRVQFNKAKEDSGSNRKEGFSKKERQTKENIFSQFAGARFENAAPSGMQWGCVPPPPPMPPMLNEMTEDSEHLSAMLMSWYMSGYYTGLYQGQKMVNKCNAKITKK